MKTHPKSVLFVALLLATGRLAAHIAPDTASHMPLHEHPLFAEVTTKFEFADGTMVEWRMVPGGTELYEVKVIQVESGPKVFSLLTLGLQSIRFKNEVTLEKGSDVMIYAHGDITGTPWGAMQTVPKIGLRASGKLDPDKIKFVSFTGRTCQFRVEAKDRPARMGDTRWDGSKSMDALFGHDNTPPDPYAPN